MAYTPNANDNTNPLDTVDISTAAAEFRTLKTLLNSISTVASATTPDIFGAAGHTINYTGTVVCTGFAAAANAGQRERILICAGAAQFTASGNLLIDGTTSGNTLIVAAGTIFMVIAITATQFRMIQVYPITASHATNADYATSAGTAGTAGTATSAGSAAALTNNGVLNKPASGDLGNCTNLPASQLVGGVPIAQNVFATYGDNYVYARDLGMYPARNPAIVTTSPTILSNDLNSYATLCFIEGYDGANTFFDIVMVWAILGFIDVQKSYNVVGTHAARTYSIGGTRQLRVAIASGTSNVKPRFLWAL